MQVRQKEAQMLKTWKSATAMALVCSLAVWFAIPTWGAIDVSFTQIDPVNFPIIECYVLVTDEMGNVLKELDAGDFSVTEQSNLEETPTVQDPVDIELIAGGQAAIAVALVIDRSTSMSEEIADAKQAARDFIALLKNEDKGAVIHFGSSVVSAQAFTHQQDLLANAVASVSVGGNTALYDALYSALQECGKTSGVKAVVAFTDGKENASNHSLAEVLELAKDVNVPVYMIGLGTQVNTDQLRNIANQTGGMYKYAPKASDLLEIYNAIRQLSRQQYLVTYTTHNPKYDGTTRTVTISITAKGLADQDSRTYSVVPSPPKISAVQLWSNETLIPWGTSIYAGQPVHITAEISDDVDVKEATLFYRTTQSNGTYYELRMDNTSGDTYGVTIPKTDIKAPGVDFYIAASDGVLTSTSPSNAPAFSPHQIAVLPNHFPVITHTPVTEAVVGELITIEAEVTDTDAGDNVDKALVYYRQGGHILYKSVPMENTAGNHYEAAIPAGEVSDLGIDYYLMAADSHGARTYDGNDTAPYFIRTIKDLFLTYKPDPITEGSVSFEYASPSWASTMKILVLTQSGRHISDWDVPVGSSRFPEYGYAKLMGGNGKPLPAGEYVCLLFVDVYTVVSITLHVE